MGATVRGRAPPVGIFSVVVVVVVVVVILVTSLVAFSPANDNAQGGANPTTTEGNVQGGVRKPKVLSFSNPQRGNFSYRRRRPDVSALRKILMEL